MRPDFRHRPGYKSQEQQRRGKPLSTPTSNSVPTSGFNPVPGNNGALQYDVKWGGPYGTSVALTYSFPKGTAWFIDPYGDGEFDAWYALNSIERPAVRMALAEWAAVARITFTEVTDGKNIVGDLRFALTDEAGNEAAHAYLPGDFPEAGDVWFKNGAWHTNASKAIKKGSYDYLVILHEIGHAIGLEHPFERPQKIQKASDSYAYTVMSYSAMAGSKDNYASFYPTTPMYYDLVNIQGMYGRGVHSPGNTTYKFKDGKTYWQTIDDSGGNDTIVHKGDGKAVIDLNIGHWSDLGRSIEFNNASTKWTVMIGPGTVIENAFGGDGKDKIVGNGVGNLISGGGGKDKLTGGAGPDGFLFNVKPGSGNLDTITDFAVGEDLIRLAQEAFSKLTKGAVSTEQFDTHFDYSGGVLSYRGKEVVKLKGAPAIDHDDLLVV